MISMKEILGAQFWNQEVESTRSLEAVVRALPNEPPPLGSQQSSRLSRPQQLLLLQRLLAVPCTPSYAVDSDDGGGWVLDRVLASAGGRDWWATLTGRVRAQRLWARGNGQAFGGRGSNAPVHQQDQEDGRDGSKLLNLGHFNWAKRLRDPSLYALCGKGRFLLGPQTSLTASSELSSLVGLTGGCSNGEKSSRLPWHGRVTLRHKLQKHDMTLEAAWHECCVDRMACYWDVPQTLSLDLSSRGARGGLRYRVGMHRISGSPLRCEQGTVVKAVPAGAQPGTRAQAAITVEKEMALWKAPPIQMTSRAHNVLSARPRVTVFGLLGGLLNANLHALSSGSASTITQSSEGRSADDGRKPKNLSADLFASTGMTVQVGKFERLVLDHTAVSLRLDCGAASAFATATSQASSAANGDRETNDNFDERGFPTVAVTAQQQLLGPVRARFDARFALDPLRLSHGPHSLETTYGLDCALGKLGAVKLVAWYSPTRREGMAEIRLLER